jgi:hypothetical protein
MPKVTLVNIDGRLYHDADQFVGADLTLLETV